MNVDQAAELLEHAERTVVGIEPFSRQAPLGAQDAWRIARSRDARRSAAGHRQTGYKLGWTSEAMRSAFGISAPNYGSLWDYMAVDDSIEMDGLIHPKAEPEFAFRAETPLEGPAVSEDDVLRSGVWCAALEVVDPRWTSYDFAWEDNTADGSSAARYALGSWARVDSPPREWSLRFTAGATSFHGRGEAVLGSPATAVAFLVQALSESGERLVPGMIVLTGGVTPPVDLRPGLSLHVESPELGACHVTCAGVAR